MPEADEEDDLAPGLRGEGSHPHFEELGLTLCPIESFSLF